MTARKLYDIILERTFSYVIGEGIMYIIYKKELKGLGFEYALNTTFGDSFQVTQHLDGMYEIFFQNGQEKTGSALLDSNEAKILSRLLDPEQET
ncbi:hypothetical protein [Oceanobacillus sojae]|uniref:hypothetical protein n=1 Tax=Oceanobacillus sojae TaxID=582851 RepID=UPI00098889AD|nr:hypothetical protein [Oceanobacillus sojae]MCT1904472.1 hypothetical protein [Oceanobacillus sojae]